MSILQRSSYAPARGGHAPGDLRDAFLEGIEAFADWQDGPEPTVEVREQAVPLGQICGLLWNCRDILPGHARDMLEDCGLHAGTYASAARLMRAAVARQVDANAARAT